MTDKTHKMEKAYRNEAFISGHDARPVRMLAEYLEPEARFDKLNISDTIVFMGSARIPSSETAQATLAAAQAEGADTAEAEDDLAMSQYYEDARTLAYRLTQWSKGLEDHRRRFVICSGGGPGIMEAANRGASEAKGTNIGLNISLPFEQHGNPYITRELAFEFHYFFMRKFWFVYLAKAVVIFPGGFGTLDEFSEILTLIQTNKIQKRLPLVLYGTEFWDEVINFDALVKHRVISPKDLDLFLRTDSVDEAYDYLVAELTEHAIGNPGAHLKFE